MITIHKIREADNDSYWVGIGCQNYTVDRAIYGVFVQDKQAATIWADSVGFMESAEWHISEKIKGSGGHFLRDITPVFTKHSHPGQMLKAAKEYAVRHYTDKAIEEACKALGTAIATTVVKASK